MQLYSYGCNTFHLRSRVMTERAGSDMDRTHLSEQVSAIMETEKQRLRHARRLHRLVLGAYLLLAIGLITYRFGIVDRPGSRPTVAASLNDQPVYAYPESAGNPDSYT